LKLLFRQRKIGLAKPSRPAVHEQILVKGSPRLLAGEVEKVGALLA